MGLGCLRKLHKLEEESQWAAFLSDSAWVSALGGCPDVTWWWNLRDKPFPLQGPSLGGCPDFLWWWHLRDKPFPLQVACFWSFFFSLSSGNVKKGQHPPTKLSYPFLKASHPENCILSAFIHSNCAGERRLVVNCYYQILSSQLHSRPSSFWPGELIHFVVIINIWGLQ